MRWPRFPLWLLLCALLLPRKTLTTMAGDGRAGSDAGGINQPFGLAIGPDGRLYFCDTNNHRISRLDVKTRKLSVVAGTGEKGYAGDGGPATAAQLTEPYEIAFDKSDNIFFCDRLTHTVCGGCICAVD